ncbi:hypothetical protein PRNP1_012482 [Phytophthora ramorum]
MASTPSPSLRHRKRPRDSIEDDEDDHALDAMLVELGIPDSGSKKKKKKKNDNSNQVIELITPPRNSPPAKKKKKQSDGQAVVDLTTPPSKSPQNGYIPHQEEVSFSYSPSGSPPPFVYQVPVATFENESPEEEVSFSYSPSESPPPFVYQVPVATAENESPEVLSPNISSNTRRRVFPEENRAGPRNARRLSGRLRDLHSETTRNGGNAEVAALDGDIRTRASPVRAKKSRATSGGKSAATAALVVVQMETSLDSSVAGDSIRNALKSHVYNGKAVPFTVATALNCIMPGVIRWERRENGNSLFSCAIYYEAAAFLTMLQHKSYTELVAAVRYLQTLVPKTQQAEEHEPSKFFVIIEGMDRALIDLKKQQQKKKTSDAAASSPMISFADLHEVAFQLFMDMGAHTKFTCDLDATADYVALLTREMVLSYSRASALEEFLESVPRSNSFRVTRTGATASACANAWLRMLQVVPGVSEDKAQCLLDHFPTFDSLMRAYRDPTLSRAQKEDLVSDKLHDVRVQRALSKRIYVVFCEENPDAMI